MRACGELAGVLVLAASCGSPTTHPAPTSAAARASSPSASTAISTPATTSIPTPSGTGLFAVLQADAIAIAGLDGSTRAKARFRRREAPDLGDFGPLLPPEARIAAGKVFYWDAEGVVRSLAVDGTVADVVRFPAGQKQQELSVAVSPDGTRLMAVVLTLPPAPTPAPSPGGRFFSGAPYSVDVYSAAAGRNPSLLRHEGGVITVGSPSLPVLQMATWNVAGPIGSYPTVLGTQGGGPHQWNGPLVQVDSNGNPGSGIGSRDCPAGDVTGDASYACVDQANQYRLRVVAGDGRQLWSHTSRDPYTYPFLAPDRSHVAAIDSGPVIVGADGASIRLPVDFFQMGWLDDHTLIGFRGSGKDLVYVRLSDPGRAQGVGLTGTFIGAL